MASPGEADKKKLGGSSWDLRETYINQPTFATKHWVYKGCFKRYSDADICWIWRYQIRFQEFNRKCSLPRHTPESKPTYKIISQRQRTLLKQVAQKNTHMSRETSLLLPHLLVCWERSE